MSNSLNIFTSLAKYADRQTENFLTESFVYLLNLLLVRENTIAIDILQKLCGENCHQWFSASAHISITTQMTITTGRPDIIIIVDNVKLAFIEVKHNSPLGFLQLERYTEHLNVSAHTEKQLVLLTRSRHSIQETSLPAGAYHHICWYQISGWLSEAKIKDTTASYTTHQFLEFLQQKEMTMEKITWEYMEGVPAMMNLTNMLHTAIAEATPEEKWRRTAGWSWIGYYVGGNPPWFIGIRYHDPLTITFENNGGNNPNFIRGLSLQGSHFFSLSAGEQLECLIKFIRESQADYLTKYPSLVLNSEEGSEFQPDTDVDDV